MFSIRSSEDASRWNVTVQCLFVYPLASMHLHSEFHPPIVLSFSNPPYRSSVQNAARVNWHVRLFFFKSISQGVRSFSLVSYLRISKLGYNPGIDFVRDFEGICMCLLLWEEIECRQRRVFPASKGKSTSVLMRIFKNRQLWKSSWIFSMGWWKSSFVSYLLCTLNNFEKIYYNIYRICGMSYTIPKYHVSHFYIGNLILRPYGCHLRISSICLLGISYIRDALWISCVASDISNVRVLISGYLE